MAVVVVVVVERGRTRRALIHSESRPDVLEHGKEAVSGVGGVEGRRGGVSRGEGGFGAVQLPVRAELSAEGRGGGGRVRRGGGCGGGAGGGVELQAAGAAVQRATRRHIHVGRPRVRGATGLEGGVRPPPLARMSTAPLFTLPPSLFTLHPLPFTLLPSPFSLHPSPFTPHSSPPQTKRTSTPPTDDLTS